MKNSDKSRAAFHQRLKSLMKDDVKGWAKKLEVTQSTIRDRWFKGSYPGADKIMRICEKAGISAEWLLFGKAVDQTPSITVQMTDRLKTFHRDFALDNYVPVRLLKDAAAAGSPREIDETDVDGLVLIYADRAWMQHDPENYTCCRVRGSSMAPILSDGDIVAIDHTDRDPRRLERKIVAFRKEGGVTIKWLKILPDGIVVGLPENREDVDTMVALRGAEVETGIIGRVAWWWAKR